MSELTVATDKVITVAQNLQSVNNCLHDDFKSVRSEMQRLDACWDGQASKPAIERFNQIADCFDDKGYLIIKNYSEYLLKLVGAGYDVTESANVKLASFFK